MGDKLVNSNTVRSMLKGKKTVSEIEEFENLIKKKPDDDRAYIRLAELYARAGKEDSAISLYEKVALLFEKKGFINKAKAVLKQAIMLNPEHGKINVLLGDLDRQSGLMKDATLRYQIAANYYAKNGNKLAAINILRKMIELYPGNVNFTLKLANMLVGENMNNEAEKLLIPLADSLKGTSKANEYASVLKVLYTATNSDSEIGKSLVNLYLKNGSYANALTVLQKLVIDNPEAIEFLEKLAFVFDKLGEKQKLIAVYKQIAVIYLKKQNFTDREHLYRKILEIDPNDRESLSVLNEQGRLRDIISDKIDSSSLDIQGVDDLDLVFDIDNEGTFPVEENELEKLGSEPLSVDIEAAIKEAGVFLSYRLFSKVIDRIQACRNWKTSPEAIDLLIQANLETGEVDTAGDLMIFLIDLRISKGNLKEATDLLSDAESILGKNDLRILERRTKIGVGEAFPQIQSSSIIDENVLPEITDEEEEDIIEEPSILIPEEVSEKNSDFANMTMDIISELQEPPQEKLDELEFYVSIEDFSSANQLLQELLLNYPESSFLAGIREIIPSSKEEDLSGTVQNVKETLRKMVEKEGNSEQMYDLALSHLSMGMFSEAITLLSNALEIDPENVRFMVGLSQAWMMAEQPGKSVEILRKAEKNTSDAEMLSSIKEQILEIEKTIIKNKPSRKKGK